MTTATKQVGDVYTITGRVFALESSYDDCPREEGDPTDGDTYCAYLATEIQVHDPVAGWAPIVSAKGMGPVPDNGYDGRGTFALSTWCPTSGSYRTYFAQQVSDVSGNDAWTDERWNSSADFTCGLPPLEGPPSRPLDRSGR